FPASNDAELAKSIAELTASVSSAATVYDSYRPGDNAAAATTASSEFLPHSSSTTADKKLKRKYKKDKKTSKKKPKSAKREPDDSDSESVTVSEVPESFDIDRTGNDNIRIYGCLAKLHQPQLPGGHWRRQFALKFDGSCQKLPQQQSEDQKEKSASSKDVIKAWRKRRYFAKRHRKLLPLTETSVPDSANALPQLDVADSSQNSSEETPDSLLQLAAKQGRLFPNNSRLATERCLAIVKRGLELSPAHLGLRMLEARVALPSWDRAEALRRLSDLTFKYPNSTVAWLCRLQLLRSSLELYNRSQQLRLYAEAFATLTAIADGRMLSHRALPDCWEHLLVLFLDYCLYLERCGLIERAIASFQAIIEFNLCRPTSAATADEFEAFWSSGAPRFGDVSSRGWRGDCASSATVDAADSDEGYFLAAQESCDDEERKLLQNHLENIQCQDEEDKNQPPLAELMLEFERIRCHWLWYPCRRENEIEDLDRLVAFDDVRACLIRLPTELTPHLVALFLLFLRCPQLELDQDCCSLLHRLQTAVGDQQLLASVLMGARSRIHFGANSATSGRGELGGFYRTEPAPNWRDLQMFRLRLCCQTATGGNYFSDCLSSHSREMFARLAVAEAASIDQQLLRRVAKSLLRSRPDWSVWAAFAAADANSNSSRRTFDGVLEGLKFPGLCSGLATPEQCQQALSIILAAVCSELSINLSSPPAGAKTADRLRRCLNLSAADRDASDSVTRVAKLLALAAGSAGVESIQYQLEVASSSLTSAGHLLILHLGLMKPHSLLLAGAPKKLMERAKRAAEVEGSSPDSAAAICLHLLAQLRLARHGSLAELGDLAADTLEGSRCSGLGATHRLCRLLMTCLANPLSLGRLRARLDRLPPQPTTLAVSAAVEVARLSSLGWPSARSDACWTRLGRLLDRAAAAAVEVGDEVAMATIWRQRLRISLRDCSTSELIDIWSRGLQACPHCKLLCLDGLAIALRAGRDSPETGQHRTLLDKVSDIMVEKDVRQRVLPDEILMLWEAAAETASAHAPGPASAHASGAASAHASGAASAHASGAAENAEAIPVDRQSIRFSIHPPPSRVCPSQMANFESIFD
ncbi:hypothetical protein BOX15_Mlig016338g2, partial [Macrostomum lignano]